MNIFPTSETIKENNHVSRKLVDWPCVCTRPAMCLRSKSSEPRAVFGWCGGPRLVCLGGVEGVQNVCPFLQSQLVSAWNLLACMPATSLARVELVLWRTQNQIHCGPQAGRGVVSGVVLPTPVVTAPALASLARGCFQSWSSAPRPRLLPHTQVCSSGRKRVENSCPLSLPSHGYKKHVIQN